MELNNSTILSKAGLKNFISASVMHIIMDNTDEGTVGVLIDGVRHSQYIGEGGTGKRFALQNVLYKFLFRIAMFDTLFSHEMNVGCGIGQTHVAEIQFFVQ